MRQRKTITTLILIVGILAVGIVYAAITGQDLTVTGSTTATTDDANFDVKFVQTGTTPNGSGDGTTVATIDSNNGKKANITVTGLTTKDQTAVATFTIENASPVDVTAKLTASVENKNTTWYDVTTNIVDTEIDKGDTTEMTVRVTLKQTPATESDLTEANTNNTFTVTINAQPQ